VWQVRRELAARLCPEAETCPVLERGGLKVVSTLDLELQAIAEKWVKAATIVPHAKNPRSAARALGLTYEPWMRNLQNKTLRNGALVAMDYQTGDLVAYVGSADATATRATKRFQPRFDVIADGWRQPGSTFKPIVYATGIDTRQITAASMFMDVVTDFGGGYTPTDADNLERGPVRVRDALRFSLNIPAVKATSVIGNDQVQSTAEAMIQFRDAVEPAVVALASRRSCRSTSCARTGCSPTPGASWSRPRSARWWRATAPSSCPRPTGPTPSRSSTPVPPGS
jgi:membrane peptidoglycan carboxypeptidase